jgi:ACR3 family arsenite efflux pump ArsB
MMINLKLETLLQTGKNAKGLSLATLYNLIWARLLGSGTTSS